MSVVAHCTAFAGDTLVASGAPADVALAAKRFAEREPEARVLVFDDATGRQIDFDLSGSDAAVAAQLAPPPSAEARGPGRPRLGVVAREVTLLPRHWDWLARQPGGASVTLRRLVDAARVADEGRGEKRRAAAAADRFMAAALGDRPGYEDASRALYAGDAARFLALTAGWPPALRDHARRLAAGAFPEKA